MQTPDIDINYGVGHRLQLKYETSWNTAGERGENTKSVLGNSKFGVKWRFIDRKIDVSTYPQFEFNPVSKEEFGLLDRSTAFIFPIEVATSLGSFDITTEIGYEAVLEETDIIVYGVVVGHAIGNVTAGVEMHREMGMDSSEGVLLFIVGAVVKLTRRHNLLASIGKSPRDTGDEPDFIAYMGIQLHLQPSVRAER